MLLRIDNPVLCSPHVQKGFRAAAPSLPRSFGLSHKSHRGEVYEVALGLKTQEDIGPPLRTDAASTDGGLAPSQPRDRSLGETTARERTRECLLSVTQLVEQGLCVLQVDGIEPLGEPAVDVGEHLAGLVTVAGSCEQTGEARRCAQLQ